MPGPLWQSQRVPTARPISPSVRQSMRDLRRILVVEDNAALARTLMAALERRASEVRIATTIAEASALAPTFLPDLLLLDFSLPDGNALDLLERIASISPRPVVVAMTGTASPDESFRLGELGVRAYLRKPLDLDSLEATIAEACAEPPPVLGRVRELVGHMSIHDVEDAVRAEMVDEALNRARGSRRRAAGLLSISRQLLQHILRKNEP